MAAPIGGLSNAKWRDDKAVQEINAEHADKRLANVLAEQEKKNKGNNDPLAYVHSGVENRMELWDRRNLGKLFRKARGTYETTPKHMARIPDRSPMHSGAVPPKHTKEEYERAHNFYQDHYDTLQHKELAKRLLVEEEKPAWQSRLEKSLMSPTKADTTTVLEKSVETRFTQDSVEIQLRRAEKWVARPLGPRPDCPWRIVACVADVGMGFSGAANLAGALDDLAEVSALCVPGRLHRGDEDVGDGPEPEYEKKEDEDPLQRFSVVTNEPKPEQSELRKWARDAHDALHALGFFEDERPWMLYGHGVGAVLAYELVRRIISVDEDIRSPLLPRRLVVSGCPPPSLFGGPLGPPPADHPPPESTAPIPLPLGKRDDIALLFYACRLRAGRDPNEQPPLSDDDRDEEPPPEHLEQWQAVQWPEVQRLRRRRALNQYRLQDLPGPLKESAALRRVAAKGVRRDYRLLESHVHDADWPLKIPITALAGEHDRSVSDEHLREWETETARDFQFRRVLGGSSYPREPAGISSLADLLRGACEEFREEADSSDDERKRVVPEPGPWSLADYYPESDVEEEEPVEAKEGFEAMLAASEKARKQLQLR